MPADPGIVIVGASLAGAKAAQALRLEHGYDGSITLVGDEPHLPYQRPALSKGYLLGTTGAADLDVLAPRFYADQDITLALVAPATALDLAARRVRLAGGTEFPFTRVLIAAPGTPAHRALQRLRSFGSFGALSPNHDRSLSSAYEPATSYRAESRPARQSSGERTGLQDELVDLRHSWTCWRLGFTMTDRFPKDLP